MTVSMMMNKLLTMLILDLYTVVELRQKINQWLVAPDPSSNHNTACKKRQPTTGKWFTQGTEFANWKLGLNSFVWLHGIRESRGQNSSTEILTCEYSWMRENNIVVSILIAQL